MAKTPAQKDCSTGACWYDLTCSNCHRSTRIEAANRPLLNATTKAAGWDRGGRRRESCCPDEECRTILAIEQSLKYGGQ